MAQNRSEFGIAARTGITLLPTEMDMDHRLLASINRLRPSLAELTLRTLNLPLLPVDGEVRQVKSRVGLSLPTVISRNRTNDVDIRIHL